MNENAQDETKSVVDHVEQLGAAVDAELLSLGEAVQKLMSCVSLTQYAAEDMLTRWQTARAAYKGIFAVRMGGQPTPDQAAALREHGWELRNGTFRNIPQAQTAVDDPAAHDAYRTFANEARKLGYTTRSQYVTVTAVMLATPGQTWTEDDFRDADAERLRNIVNSGVPMFMCGHAGVTPEAIAHGADISSFTDPAETDGTIVYDDLPFRQWLDTPPPADVKGDYEGDHIRIHPEHCDVDADGLFGDIEDLVKAAFKERKFDLPYDAVKELEVLRTGGTGGYVNGCTILIHLHNGVRLATDNLRRSDLCTITPKGVGAAAEAAATIGYVVRATLRPYLRTRP